MKTFRLTAMIPLVFATALALLAAWPTSVYADSPAVLVSEWKVKWIAAGDPADRVPSAAEAWESSSVRHPLTTLPEGAVGMWVRIAIPPTANWDHPGLLVDRLYALDVAVYENGREVYRSARDFDFERNRLLIPLDKSGEDSEVYVRLLSKARAGLNSGIQFGNFNELSDRYVRKEMPDLLFGASIAFLALIMLLCSGYLNRRQRGSWISLSLIALATSTLIITYSSLPYLYFEEYGKALLLLFDVSLFALFPALHYYVAPMFEGRFAFFSKFGRWLTGYCIYCFAVMVLYKIVGDPIFPVYQLSTLWILALFILVQLTMIVVLSVLNAFRGNRNSIILTLGFLLLALSGVADLVLLYASESVHVLFLWKIGVLILIASLAIILARRISADYSKLLTYSKELELYNHRLQRTEKMKIISDLAASVAHEVRNPMQVTRGFLQLLSKKTDEDTRQQFSMAINELDRASAIITDFLTFAKPEMDTVELLDLQEEMRKIETIMNPLAAMHGGALQIRVPDNLLIRGNPSKFKQAFINMIKNSIEALKADGRIEIEAYAEEDTAVIRITDNGEGMEDGQIAKLGEPFFSTKTKGTGLGLMVTFRIIEVMKGSLEFRSAKGKGTEAIVRFPLAIRD